jgi:hypothetical protein
MNKFMKITLAASAMLAMSFTLGCSDDKDDDKYCVVTTTIATVSSVQCYELDSKFNADACKAIGKNGGGMITSKTTSSKPNDTECTVAPAAQ